MTVPYYETTKKSINGMKRIELERRLTEEEYLTRLMEVDSDYKPIRKDRYCLTDQNQYFEIDVYPFWQDKAIVEIELSNPDEEIRVSRFLKIIREVTENPAYKNASLARI